MLPKLWSNLLVSNVKSTFSKLFKFITLDIRCQLLTWHFKSHFVVHGSYAAELCQPDNYPREHAVPTQPSIYICCMDHIIVDYQGIIVTNCNHT